MAKIIVFTHAFDQFFVRRSKWAPIGSYYLIAYVMRELAEMGHSWSLVSGPKRARGDVAVLHVDSTFVDEDYLDLSNGFPHTLNFSTADISKRHISRAIVSRGDGWRGPVIVKSNHNMGGAIEIRHNRIARKRSSPPPHPGAVARAMYDIFDHAEDVPAKVWDDESLVVERFLPERDKDGYAMRTWVFMGARETCMRHVSTDPIVKARNLVKSERAEVPDAIRRERERLGFDYGKFDFVVHEGEPALLDANRTPGTPRIDQAILRRHARDLAEGFEDLISA